MPPRRYTIRKPRGPPRTPPELRSLKASISFRAERNSDLEARIGHEQVVTMQDREAQLQRYIRELEARHQLLEGYPGKGVRALEILKK